MFKLYSIAFPAKSICVMLIRLMLISPPCDADAETFLWHHDFDALEHWPCFAHQILLLHIMDVEANRMSGCVCKLDALLYQSALCLLKLLV